VGKITEKAACRNVSSTPSGIILLQMTGVMKRYPWLAFRIQRESDKHDETEDCLNRVAYYTHVSHSMDMR